MMEIKIKSALEKALERAASFKEVPAEEIERMEHMPRGRVIAASYMNNREYDLKEALAGIAAGTEKHVIEGLQEVLLMNITLSFGEVEDQSGRRAMEGLLAIKRDKKHAAGVLEEMNHLLNYYRQSIEQTKERFQKDFEARARINRGRAARSREQEMLEFREEWTNVVRQLNTKFETGLADLKERFRAIS